jgi:hypothetical protein
MSTHAIPWLRRLRWRWRRKGYDYGQHYAPEPGAGVFRPEALAKMPLASSGTEDTPATTYQPHGIDTPETLAAIVAEARTLRYAPQPPAPAPDVRVMPLPDPEHVPAPPPMPGSGVSAIWVDRITYPDPADLSYDKDRHYRETLRHIGAATGTSTSLEDTGMWSLPALEAGTEGAS